MMRGLFMKKLKDFAEDTRKHSKLTLAQRLAQPRYTTGDLLPN